jgi:hypothetical protein
MDVFTLTSGGATIISKTTVSVFIDEMGGFVLVTAPRYKFILKKKKKKKKKWQNLRTTHGRVKPLGSHLSPSLWAITRALIGLIDRLLFHK